jgi:hypothetical protein
MMAANCERQQQRAENLPLNPAAVQSNGQCDGAEQRTERNRRRHQHRIPKNVPLDFERGHPGVMHRRDAAADDGAADRRACGQIGRDRNRKADTGQNNCRNQRE